MKRITMALIERTTDSKELEEIIYTLTAKMRELLMYSRNTYNTMESSNYMSMSIKAQAVLEKLQILDPIREDDNLSYTKLNIGDFLC